MNFLQFYLWWDCNNNCQFCFAKLLKQHKTTVQEKICSIDFAINKLNTMDLTKVDTIGLIGGEFFEDQISDSAVNQKFIELIEKCIELIKNDTIKNLYLMTHLIYKNTQYLDDIIKKFEEHNVLKNLLICTSFDPWGRFHTEERKKLWYNNVNRLRANNINVHVEMILCQQLIDAVLNKTLDLSYFTDNDIFFDFLNPQGFFKSDGTHSDTKQETITSFNGKWLPTRSSFLEFLTFLNEFKPNQLDRLFKLDIRAQHLFFANAQTSFTRDVETYNENPEYDTVKPCGHSEKFSFYSDCDQCMICDIENFKEMFK